MTERNRVLLGWPIGKARLDGPPHNGGLSASRRTSARIRQVRCRLVGRGVSVMRCSSEKVPEAEEATVQHVSSTDGGRHGYVGLGCMEGMIGPGSECQGCTGTMLECAQLVDGA